MKKMNFSFFILILFIISINTNLINIKTDYNNIGDYNNIITSKCSIDNHEINNENIIIDLCKALNILIHNKNEIYSKLSIQNIIEFIDIKFENKSILIYSYYPEILIKYTKDYLYNSNIIYLNNDLNKLDYDLFIYHIDCNSIHLIDFNNINYPALFLLLNPLCIDYISKYGNKNTYITWYDSEKGIIKNDDYINLVYNNILIDD